MECNNTQSFYALQMFIDKVHSKLFKPSKILNHLIHKKNFTNRKKTF